VKSINIALLTDGALCSGEIYKHCPPDGGRACAPVKSILRSWRRAGLCSGEIYKDCPPDGGWPVLRWNL